MAGFAGGGVMEALVCFEQATPILALCDGPTLVVRTVNAAGRAVLGDALVGKPLPLRGHDQAVTEVLTSGKEQRLAGVQFGKGRFDVVLRSVKGSGGAITGFTVEGVRKG
ncbi:hypothetical protein ACOBQX_22440 [Actinokineospora sp. G85]|uniref:hypothetical protein n=1 Tax=Actinokineospora sp. G85 TaxID=3406626 RepID=UPI003C748D1E